MSILHRALYGACVILLFPVLPVSTANSASVKESLAQLEVQRGIVAVVGLPEGNAAALVDSLDGNEITLWFQSSDEAEVAAVRAAADEAGLLGSRLFAAQQSPATIRLADNLADGIVVAASAASAVEDGELLRALRPQAMALVGDRKLVKPVPAGFDDWSHPYHGPDNNPNSTDRYVKGEFRTQFIGMPQFSPMPEQSVIAGGRIFKAMGHIAHKSNQNEMLNTLLCINAYNGTILWRRKLSEGFMIHRNTMIATDDALYMGDHESCKVIDARTGEIRREIKIDAALTDGPVWKWMALQGRRAVRAGRQSGGHRRNAAVAQSRARALAVGHVEGTRLRRSAHGLRLRPHARRRRSQHGQGAVALSRRRVSRCPRRVHEGRSVVSACRRENSSSASAPRMDGCSGATRTTICWRRSGRTSGLSIS